jgi:type II secretion system protein I
MTTGGFTLLEVLVAMVIIGLVSISALAAVGAASRASDHAIVAITASELAEERLSSLLTLPSATLVDSADDVEREMTGMPGWRWSASVVPDERGLVAITVRVVGNRGEAQRQMLRPERAR